MTKGTFQFTAASAAAIMAEYERCGVDMVVDLNHEMVVGEAKRPDSADARGWFKLEVRAGELWAVDVRWTPDGARRLADKTQRYISPAFGVNSKTGEIVDLVNCALVAMPSTHDAPALVAASKRGLSEEERATCRAALGLVIQREAKLRASSARATLGVKRK